MSARPIIVTSDYGSAEGYEAPTEAENLVNWLCGHGVEDEDLVEQIRSEFKAAAFLNNLFVDEEHRNEGHGSDLLSQWLLGVTAPVVLLLSSPDERGREGDLLRFYEGYGFETLRETTNAPILYLRR